MVRKDARSQVKSPSVQYSRLSQDDSGFIDAQFKEKPVKVPWKPIILAFILFTVGSLAIAFGILILIGHIDEKYSDRTWPLLILGSLMFIPGAYHSYLAVYAFRGFKGFDFSDIPTYGDDWY